MPRKPRSLMNCHTCGGRSLWTLAASQSFAIAQSFSVSSSRKRCSSAVSVGCGVARSLDQSGRPEKRSPSHHTVPASSASRSVCDIGGISLRNAASTPSLTSLRRSVGRASGSASTMNATVSSRLSASGSAESAHDAASAATMPAPHAFPEAFTYASARNPSTTAVIQRAVIMRQLLSRRGGAEADPRCRAPPSSQRARGGSWSSSRATSVRSGSGAVRPASRNGASRRSRISSLSVSSGFSSAMILSASVPANV